MPLLTLQRKFFLALAALLAALLLIFTGSSWLGLQRGIGQYVAEIELSRLDWLGRGLLERYAKQGSWQFLKDDPDAWHAVQMSALGDRGPRGARASLHDDRPGGPPPPPQGAGARGPDTRGPEPGPMMRPQLDVLPGRFAPPPPPDMPGDPRARADNIYNRLAVFDAHETRLAGNAIGWPGAVKMPLQHDGRTVGYLALAPLAGVQTDADRAFVAQQSGFVMMAGAAGLVLALLLSWLLARRWLRPLARLTDGAQAVAQGRFETRLPVQGNDELASLTQSFNLMAEQLAAVENSRQRWLSDVAHELRTPITALRAEIEALQDGVRRFDDGTAQRLHRQVMRLGTLVNDLRLTLDDGYSVSAQARTPVRPVALLAEAADDMRERFTQAGLALDMESVLALVAGENPTMPGDAVRLHQVFVNLLENSLRYTLAGGTLRLRADVEVTGNSRLLLICFDDSAPCPAPQDIPRLFERFFRAEASRSRESGGSGLGLAICKSIVEAHGGQIAAAGSALGGLQVCLRFPLGDTK
ncbi:ATP-binding protein [Ramlibacter sp. WS9]|uniref:ATP-binding protein n=1 Tax=Ramlibacter sp. WS9 TaxID=1882741 RepID=UPI0011426105|nr:ATP-binding protein [Ramlibacter sp. WS9]ROZ64421.1 HAMP domain-containing protein [Ramlibacter sp. WS9]